MLYREGVRRAVSVPLPPGWR